MKTIATYVMAALIGTGFGAAAQASDMAYSGKLLLTQGVTTIEGSAGGGLATWATIAGYETRDGIGANAHATYVDVGDYTLRDFGASVGLWDRVELSYAREEFDTGPTGAKLGLGKNFTFDQDIYGAKLRVLGDAVYDQDTWLPQVAVGVQYKSNDKTAIVHALGAKSSSGTDFYIAATKVLLDQSLVLDATLRATKANQTGLLGFGGDKTSGYSPEFEGSAGYLVTRQLVVGGEYRTKPDNLAFAKEDDWWDLFAAYAFSKNLSLTLAYADLGDIATFKNQHGLYVSLQAGF
jgi:hypothetical protein